MIIDILVLGILGYYFFQGMRKGMIQLVFELLAMVGGFGSAWVLGPQLSAYITAITAIDNMILSVLVFVVVWGLVYWAIIGLGQMIERFFCPTIFKPFNIVAGACLGMVKAGIYLIPLVILLGQVPAINIENSRMMSPISKYLVEKGITIQTLEDLLSNVPNSLPHQRTKRHNSPSNSDPSYPIELLDPLDSNS